MQAFSVYEAPYWVGAELASPDVGVDTLSQVVTALLRMSKTPPPLSRDWVSVCVRSILLHPRTQLYLCCSNSVRCVVSCVRRRP